MTKRERILTGTFIAVMCPFSLFVLAWWISGALSVFYVLPITEEEVKITALSGLAFGILLTAVRLKKWVSIFYKANLVLMSVIYFFWSAAALAFCMGAPFGNLILGTFAGVYVGRRSYQEGRQPDSVRRMARNAGIFTATVTGIESLLIGSMALGEGSVIRMLEKFTGLGKPVLTGPVGMGLIGVVCFVVALVQFWLTRTAVLGAVRE